MDSARYADIHLAIRDPWSTNTSCVPKKRLQIGYRATEWCHLSKWLWIGGCIEAVSGLCVYSISHVGLASGMK